MVAPVVIEGKALKSECCSSVVGGLSEDFSTYEIFYFKCLKCKRACHLERAKTSLREPKKWEVGK